MREMEEGCWEGEGLGRTKVGYVSVSGLYEVTLLYR